MTTNDDAAVGGSLAQRWRCSKRSIIERKTAFAEGAWLSNRLHAILRFVTLEIRSDCFYLYMLGRQLACASKDPCVPVTALLHGEEGECRDK